MKKILVLFLFLTIFGSKDVLASEAYSKVETKVEGNGQVYQYTETTVNGQTVKKESSQPGKLELKMEQKIDDKEATVSFSEEPIASPTAVKSATPSADLKSVSVLKQITNFLEQFFDKFLKIF